MQVHRGRLRPVRATGRRGPARLAGALLRRGLHMLLTVAALWADPIGATSALVLRRRAAAAGARRGRLAQVAVGDELVWARVLGRQGAGLRVRLEARSRTRADLPRGAELVVPVGTVARTARDWAEAYSPR